MISSFDFSLILPELCLLCATTAVLLIGLWLPARFKNVHYLLTQLTLIATFAACWVLQGSSREVIFAEHFVVDPLSTFLKLAMAAALFLVFLYGRHTLVGRQMDKIEHYVLALLSLLGMYLLVSANTLLMLYLGLELFSLPLYALIGMQSSHPYASEAGMKYFVMGGVASGMLLYGMSLLFGLTDSIVLSEVAAAVVQGGMLYNFALVFIIAGATFKLGVIPFHMWVPDVYEGSPTEVTAIVASAPKLAAFGMTYRLLVETLPALTVDWVQILWVLGIASIILGNLFAIVQQNIKRLLGFSTISHMGFVLLAFLSGPESGFSLSLFYLVVYAFTTVAVFGVLMLLSHHSFEVQTLRDIAGLNARHPWMAFLLLLLMFSLAGVPPTIGFYAKLLVLEGLVSNGFYWAAGLAMLFSVIGAFYYLRVIRMVYFESPEDSQTAQIPGLSPKIVLSLNSLLVLALGIAPAGLYTICQGAF